MDEIDRNAPSKVKNVARKLKAQVIDHKELIIGIGIGLAAGAMAMYLNESKTEIAPTFNTDVEGDNNIINNIVQTILARRGHPGNIIRCTETGEVFASQERAATVMGLSSGNLSRHLKGEHEHVKGYHFEKLGEAA